MGNVRIWTEQAYGKRGYIDEPSLSGVSRQCITPDEVVDALNLAGQPGPDREFIVVAEATVAEVQAAAAQQEPAPEPWPWPIFTLK